MKRHPLIIPIVFIGVVTIITYCLMSVGSIDLSTTTGVANTGWSFLRHPISVSLLSLLIGFFIFDRWRNNETAIAELRRGQLQAVKDIQEASKERVESFLRDKTRKMDAIDNRITGLLEEHPWITGIAENELIPRLNSCRVVPKTALGLWMRKKDPLVYEYIYCCVRPPIGGSPLEGVPDDFMLLAEFCNRELDDEHLALLVVTAAQKHLSYARPIAAYHLKQLIRCRQYYAAKKAADDLTRFMYPNWWQRLCRNAKTGLLYRNALFRFTCYISLGLFEAANGNVEKVQFYRTHAKADAKRLGRESLLECASAEMWGLLGNYDEARKSLDRLVNETSSHGRDVTEIARVYRFIGMQDKADYVLTEMRVVVNGTKKRVNRSKKHKGNSVPDKMDNASSEKLNLAVGVTPVSRSSTDLRETKVDGISKHG